MELIPQDVVLGGAVGVHDHDLRRPPSQCPLDGGIGVIGDGLASPNLIHVGDAGNPFDVYRDENFHVNTPPLGHQNR